MNRKTIHRLGVSAKGQECDEHLSIPARLKSHPWNPADQAYYIQVQFSPSPTKSARAQAAETLAREPEWSEAWTALGLL